MSSFQRSSDTKRSGKAPERSNFASTCNLLSQYLKEKGNLKDLNREITGQLAAIAKAETSHVTTATTKNSLKDIVVDLNQPPMEETATPMDTLPRFATVSSIINLEDPTDKACTSKEAVEPKCNQMTIFYDGKIWVFDDLPADEAREVMKLATGRSSHSAIENLSTSGTDKISPVAAVASSSGASHKISPVAAVASSSGASRDLVYDSGKLKELVQPQLDASDSVIPIARRSSLHRFLGKRKERAVARGPYHGQDGPEPSSKNDEQLELKL